MSARILVPLALSTVAGYVDVLCFIRYSTFAATMTGNLVITGQTFFEVIHSMAGLHHDVMRPSPEPIAKHLDGSTALNIVAFRSMVMFMNCLGSFCYCAWQKRFPDATAKTAAPFIAGLSLLPDVALQVVGDHDHHGRIAMFAVSGLAFALGFTHFLCSPAAEGSRLRAVTMAATGHMHGMTKMNYKLATGGKLKPPDWEKYAVSMTITVGMTLGAILGAAALHLNPLGSDTDDFLLVPVALTLFFALRAHDDYIPAPPGAPPAPPTTPAYVPPWSKTTSARVAPVGSSGSSSDPLKEPLAP